LAVAASEPFRVAWLATLTPLLMLTGLGAFLGLLVILEGWPRSFDDQLVVFAAIVSSPLGPIALAAGRLLRRLPFAARWGAAAAAWGWTLGVFLWLILVIT
jgi:hypothetical protein